MKKPTVFSLAREQSVFMTVIMGLMTFLGVMALGIAIAIGGAVVRWNSQWTQMATIQVTKNANALNVEKILTEILQAEECDRTQEPGCRKRNKSLQK